MGTSLAETHVGEGPDRRPGNPRPPRTSTDPNRRTLRRAIRFNAEELATVASRAEAAGRPVACYVRESALGAKPPARPGVINDHVIHQLTRVGARLRELARTASEAKLPDADRFERALQDLLDLVTHLAS